MYIDGTIGVHLPTIMRAVVGDAPADKGWLPVHDEQPSTGPPIGINSCPAGPEIDEPSDTSEPTLPGPEDASTRPPPPLEHTDSCVSQQPCPQDDIPVDDRNEPIDPRYRRALVIINARTADVTCTLDSLGAGVRRSSCPARICIVFSCTWWLF